MANEVQDPVEDEATEQPITTVEDQTGLSEQDQDALFDTLVSGEPEPKPEEKPAEEVKPEEKSAEEVKSEEPKPVEKTDAEKAQEAETARLTAEAEAKAVAPIEYKDLIPSLRKELAGKVLPILDKEGKETGRTADINDLLETYEDDIVPLITAIMNSGVVRGEMGKGKKAETIPQAIPQEFQATVNDLVGRTNLMTLCMALAAPKNGGHFDAYDIAVSEDFNQWLGKQSAPVKTKANTGGVSGSKEVLEMYKTAKGLMEDPAKKVQRQQAVDEDDLLETSAGNRGSGGASKKAVINEADLDKEFEAFSERHRR